MPNKWLLGGALMLVGLGWIAANRILVTSYPDQWGGPNFGGGALLLLAIAAIVAGVALQATSYRETDSGDRLVTLGVVGLAIGGVVLTYTLTAGDRTEPISLRALSIPVTAGSSALLLLTAANGVEAGHGPWRNSANSVCLFAACAAVSLAMSNAFEM